MRWPHLRKRRVLHGTSVALSGFDRRDNSDSTLLEAEVVHHKRELLIGRPQNTVAPMMFDEGDEKAMGVFADRLIRIEPWLR